MKDWDPIANDIFARALELVPASNRSTFIEGECCGDASLIARVMQMLRAHDDAGSFLFEPAVNLKLPPNGLQPSNLFPETIQSDLTDPKKLEGGKPVEPLKTKLDHSNGNTVSNDRRNFGDYELLDEIARGGMGVVFRARQISLNRIVALKMILSGMLASDMEVRRFRIEAELAAGLEHVGIVPVFEVGEYDGQQFFTMAFVEGGCLSDRLSEGPLESQDAAMITKQIAEAVSYAHERGVVHRDLKPNNVLLDSKGQPKIADFGLSRRVESIQDMTRTGQILGTPGFMAPEQATGRNKNISPAVDIYAIGAILYNLVTGRPPFQGASAIETLKQVIEHEPAVPRTLNATINRDLETICLKCLEKEPARRYRSAREIADELSSYLAGEPIQARHVGPATRLWKWCKRKPVIAGLSVAVTLSLVAGTIVSLFFAIRAQANADKAELREQDAQELVAQVRQQADISRRHLYNTQMNVCGISAESDGGIGLINQYLSNWIPESSQRDLRGWEWNLFESLLHRASKSIKLEKQAFALDWSPDGEILAVAESHCVTIMSRTGEVINVLDKHESLVRSIKWHPDGKRLVSGGQTGILIVWEDPRQNSEHRILPCVRKPILSLDWSHDGAILAAMFEFNYHVELWEPDATDSQPTVILGSGTQLQFAPNDNRLACGFKSELRVWNVNDVQNPEIAATLGDSNAWVNGVAWSPDGKILAAGFFDGDIKCWNIANDKVKTLTGHTGSVYHLSWSNDDQVFVSGGFDYTLRIWNATEGRQLQALRGHTDRVYAACYNPLGTQIASTGEDGCVNFWTSDGRTIKELVNKDWVDVPGPADSWCVGWHPIAESVATSGQRQTTIWNTRTLAKQKIEGAHFCWRADGELAAFSQIDRLAFWNAKTGTVEQRIALPSTGEGAELRIQSLAWNPQGDKVVVVCRRYSESEVNRTVVFVCSPGNSDAQLLMDFDNMALCASWSPDGTKIAMGCEYGTVQIWNKPTDQTTELHIPTKKEQIGAICWNPEGNRLAMGCGDHAIRIKNLDDGSISTLQGHTFPVWAIAWHPDEERLASASEDRTVRIWDTRHNELVTTLAVGSPGRAVSWHPDGQRLVALNFEGTIRMWNANQKKLLPTSAH